jgi:hypothetical protein
MGMTDDELFVEDVGRLRYNKKAGFYPALLTHVKLRTARLTAQTIADGPSSACHQLWGQPDELSHFETIGSISSDTNSPPLPS